ncbi:MAG: DUF924 family protein [Proteobacteria bacterium]|nr:DUF924 family protein [Pseudomonadota bacterium]
MTLPGEVVRFWRDAGPKAWFAKDETFDGRCRAFESAHHAAARRELGAWENEATSALALLLLLDQIPRNIFRNSPHAFAADALAQAVARRAIAKGFDAATEVELRAFLYLPLEHAEDLAAQDDCLRLMTAVGNEEYTRYARLHRDIIVRFGRFPHRNPILGRVSTAEELTFMAEGGFAG